MGGLMLGTFMGQILARIPIGFALAGAALLTLWLHSDTPLGIGPQRIVAGITPFPLLAIPLFIFAGGLMNAGGISRRLFDLADALVGRLRGGLAQTNVLTSTLFGGLSGSSIADVSSLGRILIPAMKARGYRADYSAAVTASTSIIAPILPPSILLILYGVVTGTSVGQLFFAGVVPAILLTVAYMLTVHFTVARRGFPRDRMLVGSGERDVGKTAGADLPPLLPSLIRALPALFLPVLILGGLRLGFFTPTEAAGVAVAYALLAGQLVYRELSAKKLVKAMVETVSLGGLIMLVLSAAQLYSWALTSGRVPQQLADAVVEVSKSPVVLLLLANVLLLVVGMFIDANAGVIIIVPILAPVAASFGIDPVHLGIIVVLNLGLGLITPPVGLTSLLSAKIAEIPSLAAFRAGWPFFLAGIVVLLLVTYVPQVALWLPQWLY